jgi:hypothetical protein
MSWVQGPRSRAEALNCQCLNERCGAERSTCLVLRVSCYKLFLKIHKYSVFLRQTLLFFSLCPLHSCSFHQELRNHCVDNSGPEACLETKRESDETQRLVTRSHLLRNTKDTPYFFWAPPAPCVEITYRPGILHVPVQITCNPIGNSGGTKTIYLQRGTVTP